MGAPGPRKDGSGKAAQEALFAAIVAARRTPARTARGRPADPRSERARQPWRAAGVSARTYYRRKVRGGLARDGVAAPALPQQQAAHVVAWFATLGPIGRLEHKAFVRRCLLERGRA